MSSKLSPFEFIGNLSNGAVAPNMFEHETAACETAPSQESATSAYNAFIINRGFSYFVDTALFANEMNMRASAAPKMQYDFYRHSLRPRKRWSKWFKKDARDADVAIIIRHYNCNESRAREMLHLMPSDQLGALHNLYDEGGLSKGRKNNK